MDTIVQMFFLTSLGFAFGAIGTYLVLDISGCLND